MSKKYSSKISWVEDYNENDNVTKHVPSLIGYKPPRPPDWPHTISKKYIFLSTKTDIENTTQSREIFAFCHTHSSFTEVLLLLWEWEETWGKLFKELQTETTGIGVLKSFHSSC